MAKNELKKLGWRVTPIRTRIIDILSMAPKPLTAREIAIRLKNEGGGDRATVYRDLALFLRNGVIRSVEFGDDKTRYELTAKGHHHHLICSQCKKVQDIVLEDELIGAVRHILRKKNFKVLTHSLEFFGVCNACQTK